jgi:regulator of RNase E activity RraA/CMP-N-acetylneuraminic acid synthetase
MTRIVAFVPAKGTSERIKNKNLAILDGEYLFKRKLRQLLETSLIEEVFLDTDSDDIAQLAADLPITRLVRPAHLATNATDGHELFSWECAQANADIYVQALCTAPFVDAGTIDLALRALLESSVNDSLVAVATHRQYLWHAGAPEYGYGRIPNSVDVEPTVIEAMSLYAVRKDVLPSRRRFGQAPLFFQLTPMEDVDVNWPDDLAFAELIAAGVRAKSNQRLGALLPHVTSALLSDLMREMGLRHQVLPREIKGRQRFFGRAKTLLLDKCAPGEPWDGIYNALDSYQFIRPGDVIVVENRVKDHAYFGGLNAQLAMRAGAVGAVIDGVTRDHDQVSNLGFPVFARGHYCVDIKFEGTLRSMNTPVSIEGTTVRNGDYVFADRDGVTIVPADKWGAVEAKLLDAIEKEFRVGLAVARGESPRLIHAVEGEF